MPGKSRYDGMTVNERLFEAGPIPEWDAAASSRNRDKMVELLTKVDIGEQAERISDTVLSTLKKRVLASAANMAKIAISPTTSLIIIPA